MSPRMKFGIVFTQDAPMPTVIEWCKEAEGLGFPVIGIPDSQLLVRDFIVSYTSYVLHTSQTEFIPMCSNPITRHPAVQAGAALSLHELAPGRVSVGIGSGDSAAHGLGRKQAKVVEVRDYVRAIRGLLRGEEVTWGEQTFKPEWRQWEPPLPVKIFVAADGPKTIKMAAQEADGVMVSTGIGAEPQSIQYCYDLVREGAEEVGRDPSEFEVWWVLDGVVAESREIAVSQWGATSAHFLARGSMEGKRIPEEYKAPLKAVHDAWRLSKHSRANPELAAMASKLGVQEFLIERGGELFGTTADIVRGIENLCQAGMQNLALIPKGDRTKIDAVRALGKEVLPHFQ
jgi:5,10-methylenetetrahydromethanopterin reductase